MRYAQIRPMDISNGEGIGVALFVQGCPIRCKGCFQPETWDYYGGKPFTATDQLTILKLMEPDYIHRFSCLGGEPLYKGNLHNLAILFRAIKTHYPDKKIWLWSGYTYEEITANENLFLQEVLDNTDYLIAGPFIEEEKDLTLLWRGSRNQEVIDMKQTLATGKKVTYV